MSLRSLSLALLAAVPLLSGAQAQLQLDPASLQQLNISTGCLQGLAGLVSADPGQCLGINDALAIFGPLLQQPSSSVVAPLDSYLERDFCGKPACPESFFEQARGVLDGECAQDIPQDGALNIANAVQFTIDNYAEIRSAMCLQDASTGDFCLTEMLSTLQDVIGRNVSVSTVMSAITNTTAQQELISSLDAGKERLCTDCTHALYTEFSALTLSAANLTRAGFRRNNTELADGVSQVCGAGFLDGKIPSNVRNGTSEALASNNGTISADQTTPANSSSASSNEATSAGNTSGSNRSGNPDGARSLTVAASTAAGAALLAAAFATLL